MISTQKNHYEEKKTMKKVYKSILMLLFVLIISVGLKCSLKAKAFNNAESSNIYTISNEESSLDSYEPDDPVEKFYYTLGYISVPIAIIVLVIIAIITSLKKKKNPYPQQYMNPYGQPLNSAASQAGQKNFCTKCGSKIVKGAVFCVNCGTKI